MRPAPRSRWLVLSLLVVASSAQYPDSMDAAVERVEDIHAAIFAEETQQAYPELHAARARHNRARRPLRFSGTGYRATVDVSSALIGHGAVHRGSMTSGAQRWRSSGYHRSRWRFNQG
ncbi:hypothetical protein AURDEDRAFT_130659 [Auricularia subglabra TFB-10046 SS5]|uniref:SCP domain-containing protein n=1 Tax=Auricularia subglabra (strain TFB-10046 / SS5) TaxID=717982 RepID=J0D871_AURST|nr:hypothetical protein AURDEDRAFT_130659 [Auricularia subglabra TFB-10046 SS5]